MSIKLSVSFSRLKNTILMAYHKKIKQGLYNPKNEHDSCGVGFIANIHGKKSHNIVKQGLEILTNLTHRGATGYDPKLGDGAGLLIQMPDNFFRIETQKLKINFISLRCWTQPLTQIPY